MNHDFTNLIERLKIMYQLAVDKKFNQVSKDELAKDLEKTLFEIENLFQTELNTDQ